MHHTRGKTFWKMYMSRYEVMLAWFRKPEYLLQKTRASEKDLDLSGNNKYSQDAAMSIFSSDDVLPEGTKHRKKEEQHSTHGICAMRNMYA